MDRIRRVMRGIDDAHIFNFGAKNKALMPDSESYRISAGPSPDDAIDESMARSHHRGHVMGCGTVDGKKVMIGYSSGSKVWSQGEATLPEFIKWCRTLAVRMLDDQPLPSLSKMDLLKCGKEIEELPDDGVIAADWHVEVYKAPLLVTCDESSCNLTDLRLEIDRTVAPSTDSIRVTVKGAAWNFPMQFSLTGMPQLTGMDNAIPQPTIKRGIREQPILEFLNDHPLNFYLSDFSRIAGVEHFASELEVDPFDREKIIAIDWAAAKVNIEEELGQNSIQDHLKTYLLTPDHQAVLHDHGSGEMADFVTIGEFNDTIVVKLYHVKGSGGAAPGNRVGDVYEVCGQVVKSLIWLRSPKGLLAKIKQRRQSGSVWLKGDDALLDSLFMKGQEKRFTFEIAMVQPGISKQRIEHKLGEVIAAASAHAKTGNVAAVHVLGSA